MPFRSLRNRLSGPSKIKKPSEKTSETAGYDTYSEFIAGAEQSKPGILVRDDSEPSLWQKAWEQVKKDTGWEPPPEWNLDTMNVHKEVEKIQQIAEDRAKETREKEAKIPGSQHTTYRHVYKNVAKWAKNFQFVGDILVAADPGYSTLPWALVRLAITAISGENETYETMLDGTELISELVSQYLVIERTYAQIDSELSDALVRTLLAFYTTMLKFQVRAVQYFDQRKKISRMIVGLNPVTAEDVKEDRAAIDKARQRVDHDIALVHYDATNRGIEQLKDSQGGILMGLLELTESTKLKFAEANTQQQERYQAIVDMWEQPLDVLMSKLDDERQGRELLDIRRWLSAAEPETNHEDAKMKCHMQLANSSILWLCGFAGTGKTGLVRRVIDYLREQAECNNAGRLAFFYCSNDKAGTGREETFSRADPEEALRSIVSQLCTSQQSKTVAPIVKEKYDVFGPDSDKRRNLNHSDCLEILATVSKYMPITIVLDAFDECDQDKSPVLIKHLKKVVEQSSERVKIFISTRPFPAIEHEIALEQSIEVTAENNGTDVNTFIKETLQTRISEGALLNGIVSKQLREDIESTLTSRAHNMFLYASLLLNRLCDRNRNDDEISIRKKLEELPKNLADVYNRIMEEIHDDKNNSQRSCQIAQDTFKWLLLAQEPLHYSSLVEAISPPESKANVDEILRACRTLVIQSSSKTAFEFAHYSVREHVSKMEAYSPSQCHIIATQGCLRNLNTLYGQRNALSDSQRSLSQYARLYWPLHYEGIKKDDVGEHRAAINNLLRTFLLQRRSKAETHEYAAYADWLTEAQEKAKQLRDNRYLSSKLNDINASPPTPLFAACVFGLEDIIGKFGRELDGLNKSNIHGQTALCLAIKNQKLGVVKALLSRRFPADLNLLNVKAVQQLEDFDPKKPPEVILFASALQCAAAVGGLEVVEFLIERGAHIDLVAGYYGSPLQAAALQGHQNIVSLLLSRGAEPNSQGGYHGNALQAAAVGGHNHIVSLLLENKPPALVSTPGGYYGSALLAAIHSGNSDIVLELLEEGADPNMESKNYGRPLEEAASRGRTMKEIVSHLLSFRARTDLKPRGNAIHILHRAAIYDMIDLAEHCLDNGCKIDMVATEGPRYPRRFGDFPHEMTPLAYACAEGHVAMVDLLLRRGAPFEQDKKESALLWTAAYQGHVDVVLTLLERFKAKHNTKEVAKFLEQRPSPKSGHPILFAAVSSGNAQVVRTLLDHGARYESNWYESTPLLATASFRCPNVTKVLLEYDKKKKINVCIDQRAKNGRTALFEACSSNQLEVAKLILEAGAQYSIGAGGGSRPLHVAAQQESSDLVTLLFEKASQHPDSFDEFLNIQNNAGRTALMDAAEQHRPSNLKLLLGKGARYITAYDNGGNTALHYAIRSGFDDVVESMLKKAEADHANEPGRFLGFLNHQNKDGKTALLESTKRNQESTIQLLLKHGADCSIVTKEKVSALHVSSYEGYKGIVSHLLKRISTNFNEKDYRQFLDYRNEWGKTALIDATRKNRLEIASLLLQYDANTSIATNEKVTALHVSSFEGYKDIVSLLLKRTSDILSEQDFRQFLDYRNKWGKTALIDAAHRDRSEIIGLLLECGADYSIADNEHFTALHYCAFRNHVVSVRRLLESVSSDRTDGGKKFKQFLNHQSKKSRASALRDAALQGLPEVVNILLSYSADYDCIDSGNRSPLHHAIAKGFNDMAIAIINHARRDDDRGRMTRFLNMKDEKGFNAWNAAKVKNNEQVLEALRGCGTFIEDV